MDRRYRYIRRLERRAQLARSSAGLAIIGVAICATAFALGYKPDPIGAGLQAAAPATALLSSHAPAAKSTTRRVYPFSIVPGGVASQAELVRMVRNDRVVASHYATFDVSRAYPVTVAAPRAVHVSYRKGDKVYWTAKKVMLREGETLLSDGKNEMRARCANRISDVAQFPVEAHAPSAELLDTAYEGEEGSLQNASADMIEEGDPPSLGQQPQLAAVTSATASELASTTVERTPGPAFGGAPSFADRLVTRPLAPLVAAATPGAAQQAQDPAPGDSIASAPALVVATDGTQTDDAAPRPPENAGAVPLAPSQPAAAQPELAATPRPWSAAPTAPATSGDQQPGPNELPEPGTAWLIALALGSMLVMRNKR